MSEKPLSGAMTSALEAVARMKGGSLLPLYNSFSDDAGGDRPTPSPSNDPQQGWKPAGR